MAAPLLMAGLSAGASLLGQGLNAYSTQQMNKRAENFAWKMHGQQRADHWQDLNYANQYNSPSAQMERLKEGGLNPHLVYGHGQATQPSAPSRGANVSAPNFKAPQVDAGSVLFNALQAKQLQSNIARTDAETQAILSRTLEQDYKNTFLTPEMFKLEYQGRAEKSYIPGLTRESLNMDVERKTLEQENLNLLSGKDRYASRIKFDQEPQKENLILKKMETDIGATATRTAGQVSTNELLEYEAKLIKNFGIDKQSAQQILSNLFKLVLLKMSQKR